MPTRTHDASTLVDQQSTTHIFIICRKPLANSRSNFLLPSYTYSFSFFSSRTSLKLISPQTKTLETQTQLSKPLNELPLFSLFTTVFTIAVYLTNHFIFEWSLFWRIFVQMLLDFLQIEKKLLRHGVTFNDTYIYSVHTQGSHPACHSIYKCEDLFRRQQDCLALWHTTIFAITDRSIKR